MTDKVLSMWTIYYNTSDYPGLFVARRFELETPTDDMDTFLNLDKAREWVFMDAAKHGQCVPYCLSREEFDFPSVVESWI